MLINQYLFGEGYDSDAQAFISAAGITDLTQKNAINTLVLDLKGYNLWTKFIALYPFIGGTASTHKWNLKNTVDSDAAYRLVFNGGWTHSSTGALPNGSTGYADTFIQPSIVLSLNSTHVSYYSRTNNTKEAIEIGAVSSGNYIELYVRWHNTLYNFINQSTYAESTTNFDSRGFFLGSRTGANTITTYKNGISVLNGTASSSSLPTSIITIGAVLENGIWYYSNRECVFSSIGDGLTPTEVANYYTAVQTYQTSLSRNV